MTAAVLARLGICTDVDHLCQSDRGHLCGRDEAPCPACDFVAIEKPWAPFFDWLYVEMMKCAQKRGCQHEDWWLHFSLPDIDQLPRVELPPLEDNRPAIRCPRTAPSEPVPEEARGENPKIDHVPNRGAPRELPRGTPLRQPLRLQLMSDIPLPKSQRIQNGTDSPPRGAARWRHGGHKSEHVPRAAEPDLPVSYDSPGVARPGEGRLRVIGDSEVPAIPNVPALPDDAQPMARLRGFFWHARESLSTPGDESSP